MRSADEQFAGLWEVKRRAGLARVNLYINFTPGDVVTIQAAHQDAGLGLTEIVYAADGYDAWRDGDLEQTDLSAEAAADILIKEYCEMKAQVVAKRWSMQGHDGHGNRIAPREALPLARLNVKAAHTP